MFGGTLQQDQVDGLTSVLNVAARRATPLQHLAYILATDFHETAATMQPVRETLAVSDDRAIEILDSAWAKGRLGNVNTPYWRKDKDGKSWLGRGLVQLTHRRNYETMSKVTGLDLVADPAKAMQMSTALTILFVGMEKGSFTGHKLLDFISADGTKKDYRGARKIINGTDRAMTIADYAGKFEAALVAAGYRAVSPPASAPVIPMPPKADHGGSGNAAAPAPVAPAAPAKPSGWAAIVSIIAKLFGGKS